MMMMILILIQSQADNANEGVLRVSPCTPYPLFLRLPFGNRYQSCGQEDQWLHLQSMDNGLGSKQRSEGTTRTSANPHTLQYVPQENAHCMATRIRPSLTLS